MRQLNIILTAVTLLFVASAIHAQSNPVDRFHKVIVSPYIQTTFVQGDEESVTINNILVDSSKLHVEVNSGTLRLYLDGAKEVPHSQREYREDGSRQRGPLYPNHAVVATVTYKKLDALSLRGDETYLCQSPLYARDFSLHVYGDPKVIFTEVHITQMHATIYGDANLDIRSGEANEQHYTAYGDGRINATAVKGQTAKLTAFGEAEFRLNVSDWIRIITFGQAKLRYLGSPEISKGMHFGGVDIAKLDSADPGSR